MSDLSDKKMNFKKYLPAVLLAALTVVLMFYFKENRGDFGEIVNKGKDDLLALYTENLQPLLFGTDITNEDVFNFALYQTLPIDKNENKVLMFSEENGNTSYQVIPSTYKKDTDNYQGFVKYMGFNNDQKEQLDSILESYRSELAEAVLTNERDIVAISPRLADIQKAILTDIAAFSREVDRPKLSSLLGGKDFVFLDSREAFNLVDRIKQDTTKEYLIISEDTAFISRLEFNNQELEQKISEMRNRLTDINEKTSQITVKASRDSKFMPVPPPPPTKYKHAPTDTGYSYSYTIPDIDMSEYNIEREGFDSLRVTLRALREELNNISFNIDIDSLTRSLRFDMQELRGDTLHNVNFEFNFDNLGEIINRSIESATRGEMDEAYWERFGIEMDSLANEMVKYREDSVRISEEMKKKVENMKKLKSKKK